MLAYKKIPAPGACVILADGRFPVNETPLEYLRKATFTIACDGAADALLSYGLKPDIVIGDLDSVSEQSKSILKDRLVKVHDQETNDLTKAVRFALTKGFKQVVILGASGKREDHTLGNMGLLFEYCKQLDVTMISDYGIYLPLIKSSGLVVQTGQQISIFANKYDARLDSRGLKYPLNHLQLTNWWMGTLNEAENDKIEIRFDKGEVLVGLIFMNGK